MTTTTRIWQTVAVSTLAAALLVAGCGSGGDDAESSTTSAEGSPGTTAAEAGFDEIVAQAEEEGQVTLYTSQFPDRLADFEKAFEAAYDIDLTVVRANDSDNIPRIETEHQTGFTADV